MFRLQSLLLGLAVLFAAISFAPSAHALPPVLETAQAEGKIGERADGYLGVVDQKADAQVVRTVNEVNNKRRAAFEKIAAEKGATVEQVGLITGEKQIAKLPAGAYYMAENGAWTKK